jgi:hypothetical protein
MKLPVGPVNQKLTDRAPQNFESDIAHAPACRSTTRRAALSAFTRAWEIRHPVGAVDFIFPPWRARYRRF